MLEKALEAFLTSTIAMATPILLAALGELIVEESGIINIGIEGAMLTGAFLALSGVYFTGSVAVGLLCGMAAAITINAILGVLVINLAVNQVVAGTALDILAAGITGFFYRRFFGITGKAFIVTPLHAIAIGPLSRIPLIGPIAVRPESAGLLRLSDGADSRVDDSSHALWIAAARPVNARRRRTRWGWAYMRCDGNALIASGVLTGLAGAFLTVAYANTFVENISAGRGFVALAVVILGRRSPWGLAAASILFGAAMALQFGLQALGTAVPYQLFLALRMR